MPHLRGVFLLQKNTWVNRRRFVTYTVAGWRFLFGSDQKRNFGCGSDRCIDASIECKYSVKSICIDDYSFSFCRGCRSCHNTAKCVMSDAAIIESMVREFDEADITVSVSPSYWLIFPDNLRRSLTDALHGAIHMSHMHQWIPWCWA